jgi:hypothetical protein
MSTAEEKSVTFPLPTPKTDREGKTTIQSFETSSKGIRYIVEEQRDTYGRILTSRKFTAETISGFLVEDADLEDAEKVLSQFSSDGQVYIYKGIRMFSFRVDASDIGEYSDLFSTVSELEIVEKIDLNEAISPQVSTTAISINDPYFSSDSLWHLENAGSGSNVAQADISATWAWYAKDKINTSGLLAIIDTGVIAHNDLPSNYVYTPPPPTPPPPTGPVIVVPQAVDYYGTGVAAHGTWMAGVASAKSNNSLGVAGVAPNSNVANLNVYDPVTEEILSSSVAAAVGRSRRKSY